MTFDLSAEWVLEYRFVDPKRWGDANKWEGWMAANRGQATLEEQVEGIRRHANVNPYYYSANDVWHWRLRNLETEEVIPVEALGV